MAHKPEEHVLAEIEKAGTQIVIGARYGHYKDRSKTYRVVGFAIIEATDELGVIYQADYGAKLQFVRPVSVWAETLEWEGQTAPRFKKVRG